MAEEAVADTDRFLTYATLSRRAPDRLDSSSTWCPERDSNPQAIKPAASKTAFCTTRISGHRK